MSKSILLIDHDQKATALLEQFLSQHGFKVISAQSPSEGMKLLRLKRPQLVVVSSFELCSEIRKESQVPLIMIGAQDEATDRIVALRLGADDFVARGTGPQELLARIEALLRRTAQGASAIDRFEFAELVLDLRKRMASVCGTRIDLSTTEFDALLLLVRHAGEVISRDRLMEHLRGHECEAFNRAIDTLISRVRTKLGDNPQKPRFIKTVWGTGYVFIAEEQKI